RRNLLTPTWKDEQKIEFFEFSLKSGSYAKNWFNKLLVGEKDTFANLVKAFKSKWPEKEMAEKEKGELHEELLTLVLRPEDIGVRIEEDGVMELGHVRWVIKAAQLAADVGDTGGLITQVLKNVPDSLLLRLGPKRGTWEELVQTMKDVPASDLRSVRNMENRLTEMEGLIAAANLRARLTMILAKPVTIHPRTPAGAAAYKKQVAEYTQKYGARKLSEDRPYPLTPGTVAVGSGECHKCGTMGHFSADCTTAATLLIPEVEVRWRQIVQSIRSRIARSVAATAVNIVDNASDEDEDVFGTAEYDQRVIEEYLRSQGKAGGPERETARDEQTSRGSRVPEREEESLGDTKHESHSHTPSRGAGALPPWDDEGGRWYGEVVLGGVRRKGAFEVFPSGGAWTVLFGKPLLEAFGAWHGYEEDVIVL
ncbi:hypothetical protein C8R47DRAFT_937730, partial [Mycena vitilis]